MHQYFALSDSLCEIGEYEKARDYLMKASLYLPYLNQSADERKENVEIYWERKRKIDVLITYELTDSGRYTYRMGMGYDYLKLEQYDYAAYYFTDAQRYTQDKTQSNEELKKIINQFPTDTIKLSVYNTASIQLLQQSSPEDSVTFKPYIGAFNFYENAENPIYLRKDSSLFTGTITFIKNPIYIGDIAQYKIWDFKDGYPINETIHYLSPWQSHQEKILCSNLNQLKILQSQNFDGYYYGIATDWKRNETYFYANGAISETKTSDGNEGFIQVKYDQSGDTSELFITKKLDEFYTLTTSQSFNNEGQLEAYWENIDSLGYYPIHSFSFTLNAEGDTLTYEKTSYMKREGLFMDLVISREDELFALKSTWKSDTLIDYVNAEILYFDEKGNLISESTFLKLINTHISESPEYLVTTLNTPITYKNQVYTLLAYPMSDIQSYGWNTGNKELIWRKIDRKVRKLGAKP